MKIMDNELVQIVLGFLVKIIAIVLSTMFITFLFSKYIFESNYARTLENVSMIVMAIGVASLMGGVKTLQKPDYLMAKLSIGASNSAKIDYKQFAESYGFCVTLGIAGIVSLLISYLLW